MHRKITGITIGEAGLTAVQVRGGLNGHEVTACTRIDLEEKDLGKGLDRLAESMELTPDRCVVAVSPHQVSFRNLEMPFKDARKIRQTLPYEMETLLPFPVEDMVIDFIGAGPGKTGEILSASVKKEMISSYLETCKDHGIDPDRLDVMGLSIIPWLWKQDHTPAHFILLDMEEKRLTLFLSTHRHVALIRTLTLNRHSHCRGSLPLKDREASTGAVFHAHPKMETTEGQAHALSLFHQVRHTIHAYMSGHEQSHGPEKVFLTAGDTMAPEIDQLLRIALDMPVERIDVSRDKRVVMPEAVARDWDPGAMNSALALAIQDHGGGPRFDFRKYEFEKKSRYPETEKTIRKVMVFFVLILALLAGDFFTDYYFLKREYERLDTEIVRLFKKTLPGATRIVDPVQQVRVEIQQLKKDKASTPTVGSDRRVLNLLADISRRIPGMVDVHVSRMILDPATVRISGKTDTFNSVDSLKNALAPSKFFSQVIISSANLDRKQNRVKFEMKLNRNP